MKAKTYILLFGINNALKINCFKTRAEASHYKSLLHDKHAKVVKVKFGVVVW